MPEQYDLLGDVLKHSEMIVFWSNDPDSTRAIYSGQESMIWRQWLKEKGIKTIFLDPFYNFTAAHMDESWLPLRPDSGTAVAMAIAFVWITENTYDKDYVRDRTIGFEDFRKQILGETDGQPKTPEWAKRKSGIPARKIRSLAREWAAKRTGPFSRDQRRRRRCMLERDDIGEWAAAGGHSIHGSNGCNYRVIVRQKKCIEPLWESKSDYDIFSLKDLNIGEIILEPTG